MSILLDVADAVTAEITAPMETFSEDFTPVRKVLPDFGIDELKTLHVTVVPHGDEIANLSRTQTLHTVQVDIGVQMRLGPDIDTEIEGLLDLVEEIAAYLRGRRLASLSAAYWQRAAYQPVYSHEHLTQDRVFTSILTVTYLVAVDE